jgi:hypothetical protein
MRVDNWRLRTRAAHNACAAAHKLYLGEINDQQQAAWRKTLSVFDEQQQEYENFDTLQVKLSGLELRHPRLFGSCWLACELWQQLGLDEFWDSSLGRSREDVPWEKVLQLLVVSQCWIRAASFVYIAGGT